MRTLELHAHAKQVKRSSGRSSVAAAAYRSGSILRDDLTGEVHDYTRKGGVEFSRIYTPDDAPEWAQDRQALWNAVEVKENRKNSTLAHELEIAFPAEFNAMQRREAGDAISRELVSRYGVAVDIAYHEPSALGDERNHHAHILFTTRGVSAEGWDRTKFRDLSADQLTVDGEKTTRGKEEIKSLREFVSGQMNRIAERDRLEVRTEHLSFEARGIDREPSQHLGPIATEMERSGKSSHRGVELRLIEERNQLRDEIKNAQSDEDRKAAFERLKFTNWEARKHAIFDAEQAARVDKTRAAEQREKDKLSMDLERRHGGVKSMLAQKADTLETRLKARGLRKMMRDIFGRTRADERSLGKTESAREALLSKERAKKDALEVQQKKRRDALDADSKRQRRDLEKGVEKARGRRDREGWVSHQDQLPSAPAPHVSKPRDMSVKARRDERDKSRREQIPDIRDRRSTAEKRQDARQKYDASPPNKDIFTRADEIQKEAQSSKAEAARDRAKSLEEETRNWADQLADDAKAFSEGKDKPDRKSLMDRADEIQRDAPKPEGSSRKPPDREPEV